jgi:hypothetical protein
MSSFSALDLIAALQEVERQFPLAQLASSAAGTGNLVVFDHDDSYVGTVELRPRPVFIAETFADE